MKATVSFVSSGLLSFFPYKKLNSCVCVCVCVPSVSIVKSKLDPENLGIILLGPFLLEFFPNQVCGAVQSFN